MPTLTTRLGTYGKGSALSHAELDDNFKRPVTAVTSTPVTLTASHNRNIIECGTGSGTLALTAAATLAAIDTEDWFVDIVNTTSSSITIDPNSSETIDGSATYTIVPGGSVRVFLDAAKTGFRTSGANASTYAKTLLAATSASAARTVLGITLPYMWLTGGSGSSAFCTGGATRYADFSHGLVGQVSEASLTSFRAPAQGRLSNFRLRAGANTIGATSTATIRVNGVDTALSLSFNTLQASNTSDTINVSAGDIITIGFVGGGSSGSASGGAWSMKFEAWSW